jgi:thiol-disulfide isomerase/thioredoxin
MLFSKDAETLIMNPIYASKTQLNLRDTIYFRSNAYRNYLKQFLRCNILSSRKSPEQEFELINEKYNGKIKDYLLLKTYDEIYRTNPNERLVYSRKFESYCSDTTFRKYVQQTVYDLKYLTKNSSDILVNHEDRQISFDSLITSLKGSLIYLDFWASWCLPCRIEMPASLNLAAKLRNEKIKFLYISTDDNVGDWHKAAGQEKLQKVNSYKIINFNMSKLKRSFSIEAIPRYLLIDKHGKIIESDAPRPTDKKLIEIISKYL